jgi:DNA polymerase III, delta subunit
MKPKLYITTTQIDENKFIEYLKTIYKGKWIISDYSSKSDFKEDLANLNVEYPIPTNLLLGNLDQLSLNFQQSLLKFLEEPPHNLQIIASKESIYGLLPTIQSRVDIIFLKQEEVTKLLDENYLEKIKKLFPPVKDNATKLISSKLNLEDFGDLANIERTELIFYLWQIEFYLNFYYSQEPNTTISKRINEILLCKQNLQQNLQKKIALTPLFFI